MRNTCATSIAPQFGGTFKDSAYGDSGDKVRIYDGSAVLSSPDINFGMASVKNLRLVSTALCYLMLAMTVQAAPLPVTHFPANDLGQFLGERFDLASIRSSFGPRRSPTRRTFADFLMTPSTATEDVLEFDAADWFYQFRIVGRRDANGDGIEDLEVCFTDQARGGASYSSQQSLLITRYAPDAYAVALNFGVDACERAAKQVRNDAQGQTAARTGDSPDYERVGRFIYAFHRAGGSIDALNGPVLAMHAPPELAARAKLLAQKFDFIVNANATVTDAEMQATLREATAVSALIAEWRRGLAK